MELRYKYAERKFNIGVNNSIKDMGNF